MGLAHNNSEEEVVGSLNLYTGIFPMQVVAVNPTLDELKELGVKLRTAPVYSVTIQETEFNKIAFWLRNAEHGFIVKMEILVRPAPRVSTKDDGAKRMYINNVGQMTWSAGIPTYDWWQNPDKTRVAYVGEDILINFTKAWANIANGGEVSYDTIEKIVNGDVSEIRSYIPQLKNNLVRLLLGVKENKYQAVYTKHFGRLKPERNDYFAKELAGEYGSFDADFGNDLAPKKFVPSADLITPDADDSATAGAASVAWGAADGSSDEPAF